ncbi:phosphoglycolate phosphatase 1A, chloroplastic isoform X1 [Lucilia cuprina]|uniref:phosphoglycolate phosphatase 1A, chloroplastic isoform X1 n=1 Tax=Lucilia cuprina TaxID=7375 RepID=UPI001F054DDC|nr:phosphoglycolate phosphatase 1A, chloroplastic isoform X1 [Lucilia cuprina]
MLKILKTYLQFNKTMTPRNILTLSSEEKRKFLDSFDHVFSDIDGVVWNMSHIIEGSAEGFNALRQAGKQLTFITNNSVRPEEQCIQKLIKNNIDIKAENIMHPAKSIVEYLNNIKFKGLIYIIASEEFKNVLKRAGYELLEGPNVIVKESFTEAMGYVVDSQPVKAVVIDFDFNLSFLKLMKANLYLRQPDCLLIGGATDFLLPVTKDLSVMGPGPFVKILEETSRKEMLTFGKPGKALAEVLMQRSHIPTSDRVLMIGDMLEQDIRFATSCGFQSLLVLSGGTSYEELMSQKDENIIPNYYAQSVADFVEFIKDVNKSNV